EFIRRVYLDLASRIPTILEARDFLDDDRPNKRRIWVEKILASDRYAEHFANVWRALWLPSPQDQISPGTFEAWLRKRLAKNDSYDQIVRDLLSGTPSGREYDGPAVFYQANEQKPENLTGSVSRLFLGIRLECAQCHNDRNARWTRKQ